MMLSKLRNRFLLLNMVLTLLTLFAAFAVVYFVTSTATDSDNKAKLNAAINVRDSYTPYKRNDGSVELRTIDENYNELMRAFAMPAFTLITDDNGVLNEVVSVFDSAFNFDFGIFSVSVIPVEENVKSISFEPVIPIYKTFLEIALANRGDAKTAKIEGRVWLYSVIDIAENKTQFTFLDITETTNRLNNLMLTFAVVGMIMVVIIFLISLFMANRSIKPVKQVWDKQRQFVSDASHELKTPLAVMTSTYSALQANENETIKSQSEFFGYMKSGMDKMAKLINDLLSLARMENANRDIACTPFDIGAEVKKAAQKYEALIQEKSVTLSCSIEPNVVINSDKMLSIQAFEILFDNAVKYVNESGTIDVTLKREKQGVICMVGNSGAGIDKDDIPKIFDRFYRTDRSRSSETGGYGLGLSIAKTIMNTLGGEIKATSEKGWTVFSLTWHI